MHGVFRITSGFLKAIVATVVGGALIGVLAAVVSNLIYVMLLFPLVIGFVGVVITTAAVQGNRIHRAAAGAALGLLTAGAILGAFHYTKYLTFRLQVALFVNEDLREQTGEYVPELGPAFVDYALQDATGHAGFLGFLLYTAEEGLNLSSRYGLRRVQLDSTLTWTYWALELLIIGGMTVHSGLSTARNPFCDHCDKWYGRPKHIGGFEDRLKDEGLQALARADFKRLKSMLVPEAEVPSVEFYLQQCETCNLGDNLLEARRIFLDSKGRPAHDALVRRSVPSSAFDRPLKPRSR